MHQNSSTLPVPAPVAGALSTGDVPQQPAGVRGAKLLQTFWHVQIFAPTYLSTCLSGKHASGSTVSAPAPHQAASMSKGHLPCRRSFIRKTGDEGVEEPFGNAQMSGRSQAMQKVPRTGAGFRGFLWTQE